LIVVFLGTGIAGYLWGNVIAGLLVIPLMWWRAARRLQIEWGNQIDRRLSGLLFRYSLPLVLTHTATWVLQLSDRYVLQLFRSNVEVGIYSASYSVADNGLGLILSIFQMSFVVLATQVFERDGDNAAARFIERSVRVYLLASIPAVVGMSVLGQSLVAVMTGPEYAEGSRIVPLVSLATLFSGLAFWRRTAFMFYKRTNLSLLVVGVAALVNIGLNFILVPRFGYMAAAVTTLIGYMVLDAASRIISKRLMRWRIPMANVGRIAAASAGMGLVLFAFLRFSELTPIVDVLFGIPLGVAVYVVGLVVFGEVRRGDLLELRMLLRRSGQSIEDV
jgi:O-antigen/teichoic acid export membrane protein